MSVLEFHPEFDTLYSIDRHGNVSDYAEPLMAPDVTLAPASADVDTWEGWHTLAGHTGQYGYRGAVMHPSEQWGHWAIDALSEAADTCDPETLAVFAVVEVRDEDGSYPDGDAIGWAVAYRLVSA